MKKLLCIDDWAFIKLLAPYKMSFYTWTTSYHLRTFPGKWTVQKSISIHIRVYWEASTLKEREMGLQVLLSTPRFSHYTMSPASPSTGPTHCSAHLSAIHRLCRSHKLSACRADRTQGETQKEGQQAGSLNILWFWEALSTNICPLTYHLQCQCYFSAQFCWCVKHLDFLVISPLMSQIIMTLPTTGLMTTSRMKWRWPRR